MKNWYILAIILLFSLLFLLQGEEKIPEPIMVMSYNCPFESTSIFGISKTLPSGKVLIYCKDGVYTEEQLRSNKLFDEGEK